MNSLLSLLFVLCFSCFVLGEPKFSIQKSTTRQQAKEITIGGVSPISDLGSGVSSEAAFRLALQDLTQNTEIWPQDWKIKGVWKDSACDPATGVGAVIQILKENPDFVGLIGPDCSGVSVRVAKLAQYYSFPLISPISTSPSLSNKDEYPLFSRVVASDLEQAWIWLGLMKYYSWRSVAILHSHEEVMKLAVSSFTELAGDGYNIFTQEFVAGQFDPKLLENIQEIGYTIIILATYLQDAVVVFSEAENLGMAGEGYAWMGPDGWQSSDFSSTQPAGQGSIGGSFSLGSGPEYERLVQYVEDQNLPITLEIGYVYDATMALGRALGVYLRNETFSGQVQDISGELLTELIRQQDFQGVTGRVIFDENGDRQEMEMIIHNLIGTEWKKIGTWDGSQVNISEPAIFPGGTTTIPTDETLVELHLLGLFPWSGTWPVGSLVQPGFELAIKHAQTRMPNGWSIIGHTNDTKCDPGTGMAQIVEAHDNYDVLAVIGPGCSDVSIPCGLLTPSWDIPMVSWGSTAPSLQDSSLYPTFFRVVHNDESMAQAWLAFCQYFGWQQVSVLFSTDEYPQGIAETFVSLAEENGITVFTESFISSPELNPTKQLTELKKKSTIFFLSADQTDATLVFKTAASLGMTGDKYAWFGTDAWQVSGWEETTGDADVVANAGFGSLGIGLPFGEGPQYDSFLAELEQDYNITETHINTAYAYDATMFMVNIILDMISSNQNPRDKEQLLSKMGEGYEFTNLTGPVQINSEGERIGITFKIRNFINGQWKEIGQASQVDGQLRLNFTTTPVFPGNTSMIPDGVPQQTDFDLSWGVRYLFLAIAIVLIVILVIVGILFIAKKEEKLIKLSGVNIGLATLVGLLLYYICVFLLYPEPSDSTCLGYIWVLKIAFCITFGTLFVKTVKLYRMMTAPESPMGDGALFGLLTLIVLSGVIYLILWTAIDPYKLQYETDSTDETVRWLVCKSDDSSWKWVAFGLECGFMIVGAILAWKVRNFPTQANEATSVAYSMYNIFIVQVVLFSVVASTDADPNVIFALECVTVLAIATGVLAIVFGNKLFSVIFPQNSTSSTISSLGKSNMSGGTH